MKKIELYYAKSRISSILNKDNLQETIIIMAYGLMTLTALRLFGIKFTLINYISCIALYLLIINLIYELKEGNER